ncbi:hypothetical protein CUK41_08035 [Salmonella enterica]|nr:hypothetical protein [Salmonella enterica]
MHTSDTIALWTALGTWLAAIATVITAVITGLALCVAFKTLHSWKDKEKFMQLVRVKRSVFAYRQKVESMPNMKHDNAKINDYLQNVLQPALTDIFHEMELAGLKGDRCTEAQLFNELFAAQKKYEEDHLDWAYLFKCSIKLQEAIDVSF